jgi:hypothetical protein
MEPYSAVLEKPGFLNWSGSVSKTTISAMTVLATQVGFIGHTDFYRKCPDMFVADVYGTFS